MTGAEHQYAVPGSGYRAERPQVDEADKKQIFGSLFQSTKDALVVSAELERMKAEMLYVAAARGNGVEIKCATTPGLKGGEVPRISMGTKVKREGTELTVKTVPNERESDTFAGSGKSTLEINWSKGESPVAMVCALYAMALDDNTIQELLRAEHSTGIKGVQVTSIFGLEGGDVELALVLGSRDQLLKRLLVDAHARQGRNIAPQGEIRVIKYVKPRNADEVKHFIKTEVHALLDWMLKNPAHE